MGRPHPFDINYRLCVVKSRRQYTLPNAGTMFSASEVPQHHQLLDGVDVAHWSGFAVFTQASDPGRRITGALA